MQQNMDAYIYSHATLILEAVEHTCVVSCICMQNITLVQLDPVYLNSIISNSLLFQPQNNLPWICPSLIYYQFFHTPAI